MAFFSSFSRNLGILLFLFSLIIALTSAQLSANFYSSSCPNALSTIKLAVKSAGCDASILLDDTANFTGEKNARPNANSVRGYEVIDNIKKQLESSCPGVVSCADIVAVAARDSVVELGGPSWTVRLGRRDSTTASQSAANSNIPAPTLNLAGLISAFSNKGFTAKELVALSGLYRSTHPNK
ncbi:hypothetical protein TIFTF001_033147 [Ficus carica]|uniref:peroxidase n=1 Tax=Ficus carica TaxID=3494 RepID=A0AA88DXY0_FICCA|nr:hypothetical protein TIFTF001_033147 [Ficus carica]